MHEGVRDYDPEVQPTGRSIADLIPGTSFFPGGMGLWRGDVPFGDAPHFFPEAPIMFLAHNFDSIEAYKAARKRGGEGDKPFWKVLKDFLQTASVDPSDCFFTNALMGLKPGAASGKMPSVPGYKKQCRCFLLRQIEIVGPRAIVVLGSDAESEIRGAIRMRQPGDLGIAWTKVMHPSARSVNQRPTRAEWIAAQSSSIRELVQSQRRDFPASVLE
jgi:hypothetical protein